MENEGAMSNSDCQKVGQALQLLGTAYRMDWSDFDGRTLRDQLNDLAGYLTGEEKGFDLEAWAFGVGICPEGRSWTKECVYKTGTESYYECGHLTEFYAQRRMTNE